MVTNARSDCELLNNPQRDLSLSELGDISLLKEEQRTAPKVILRGKDVHPGPAWLWQEFDIDWPLLNVKWNIYPTTFQQIPQDLISSFQLALIEPKESSWKFSVLSEIAAAACINTAEPLGCKIK